MCLNNTCIKPIKPIKHAKLFVLCFPHLGTLDNWLPVVDKLINLSIYQVFTLIIPNMHVIRSFHKDNAVVKISNEIFDSVLIHAYDNVWVEHKSIFESMQWYDSNRKILRLLDILNKRIFSYTMNWAIVFLRNRLYKKQFKLDIDRFNGVNKLDVFLYDIHSERNRNYAVKSILKLFENNSKYSLPHQLSLLTLEGKEIPLFNIKNKRNIKVFTYADFQGAFYKSTYEIDTNKMYSVGIPRHDFDWIQKIQNESPDLPDNFNNNTVVVFSLQVSNAGLSFDQKVKAVANIKFFFIDKLHMKVVIKLHPSEKQEKIYADKNNKIYENILGLDNYGTTWTYSDLHVFALGKNKSIAISLGTAVTFDMVAMGVPCVEYVDSLADISINKKYKRELSEIVKYKFVEGVSSYKELQLYINKVIVGGGRISDLSTSTYKKYFSVSGNASNKIVKHILKNT